MTRTFTLMAANHLLALTTIVNLHSKYRYLTNICSTSTSQRLYPLIMYRRVRTRAIPSSMTLMPFRIFYSNVRLVQQPQVNVDCLLEITDNVSDKSFWLQERFVRTNIFPVLECISFLRPVLPRPYRQLQHKPIETSVLTPARNPMYENTIDKQLKASQ